MQILTNIELKTTLKNPFHYSIFPIILLTLILTILLVVLIFLLKKKRKKELPVIIKPSPKNSKEIKSSYLKELDELLNHFQNNKISNRLAYQTLSKLIRNFIYEMTNIKVQNYTLADIQKINMPILYELVKEYYDPEFSKNSKGDIIHSIEKTRKVIEVWN